MNTSFVQSLPTDTQDLIRERLTAFFLSATLVDDAMDSRVCDLADTIDVSDI